MIDIKDFSIQDDDFVLNGQPIQLLAGAMHYFRVRPELWADRMKMMRPMGLNAVETYMCWNRHEPTPGEFDFSSALDLARYLETAAENDLLAVVRPGPYICSETDFGSLPWWLLSDPTMRVRCMHQPYIDAVDRYLDAVFKHLTPMLYTNGGPVVALQIENEYGSYGDDHEYLRYLEDGMRARGADVLFFTSDGPRDYYLTAGTLPHVLKTVNFGSGPTTNFAKLREHQPQGPMMCGEFWCGWFDHWGKPHNVKESEPVAAILDEMLGQGASVSFYMFHGGTNFGFTNGANGNAPDIYDPMQTSYDFDAPLSECGDVTPKYEAFREVIKKHVGVPDLPVPQNPPKRAYGTVAMRESAELFESLDTLSTPVDAPLPKTMEELGQGYGFILYSATVLGPREEQELILQDLHDRALVFLDGEYLGERMRARAEEPIHIELTPGEHKLDILVENMGRINYGPYLLDRKGITHAVRLGLQILHGWTMRSLPLTDLSGLTFSKGDANGGTRFYRGTFEVDEAADTFVALPGWTKGVCWINGFNLGRYWNEGPQRRLYLPAPLLKEGTNEIVLFELHGCKDPVIELCDAPDLGPVKLWDV